MITIIEAILNTLQIPYYFLQYNGADGKEDPYIVYSLFDYPAFHSDGNEQKRRYTVSFSIYGTNIDDIKNIIRSLKSALEAADFDAAGGGWWGDDGYPAFLRYTIDYYYDFNPTMTEGEI